MPEYTDRPLRPVSVGNQRLNSTQLAAALNCGIYVIKGIKKANKMFNAQGKEPLIFTGRLSTPAKVSKWLDDHPDFVARQVLRRKPSVESPELQPLPPSQPA